MTGLISLGNSQPASINQCRSFRTLADRIPEGAWDSHMHVVDAKSYPLAEGALYRPNTYSLDDALTFQESLGLDNTVFVQPSIYGYDNSCMLDALLALGTKRGRAVVAFEPQTVAPETLREWHRIGVRGVRLNLSSVGKALDQDSLREILLRYAEDCRPLGWVIQVYVPMRMIELLEPIVSGLGVRVCIDHVGHPDLSQMGSRLDPYDIRGFSSLIRLLKGGDTFVKLSAGYRCIKREGDGAKLEAVCKEILRQAGKSQVIFATDWPHTRFEGLDIKPWVEEVLDWCDDQEHLTERVFRDNAEDLWGSPS